MKTRHSEYCLLFFLLPSLGMVINSSLNCDSSKLFMSQEFANRILYSAIWQHKFSDIDYALQIGADINARGYPDMGEFRVRTPLYQAVYFKDKEIVRKLLESGADPNLKNEYGFTALHLAVIRKYSDIIADLFEYGALSDIKDDSGNTAFDYSEL